MQTRVHPIYKLGRWPSDPRKPRLKLHWRAGIVPPSPDSVDHSRGWSYDLGGNNQFGTCGPTAIANHEEMTSALLGGLERENPLASIFDLYRRSGNPTFDPNTGRGDNGVINTTMMDALMSGGLNGRIPIATAELVDRSDASLFAAIDLFGGAMLAVWLQTAQQWQTDLGRWDYTPSPSWGGHDVLTCKYDKDSGDTGVVTWQRLVEASARFRQQQCDEVWVILWPEIIESGKLWDSGVDYKQLAADYQALTGKPFPAVPPSPPPQPPGGSKIMIDLTNQVVSLPPGWQSVPNTAG